MKPVTAFIGGTVITILFVIALAQSFRVGAASVPPPAVIEAPPIDDSWVVRRLGACDSMCGPVPMEVHATRDMIDCLCGRPDRIRPLKSMPKGGLP